MSFNICCCNTFLALYIYKVLLIIGFSLLKLSYKMNVSLYFNDSVNFFFIKVLFNIPFILSLWSILRFDTKKFLSLFKYVPNGTIFKYFFDSIKNKSL